MDLTFLSTIISSVTLALLVGWFLYLILRTDANDGALKYAQGYAAGQKAAQAAQAAHDQAMQAIAESQARQAESEQRHREFLTRQARLHDAVQTDVERRERTAMMRFAG